MSESDLPDAAPTGDGPPQDAFARELRGFGLIGIGAIVFIVLGNVLFLPLTGLLVLAWRWRSGTPWAAIGYMRPKSWVGEALAGLLVGGALKLGMKALVLPLFFADPVNHAFGYLRGNPGALPGILYAIFLGAGFGEETFWRGFLFERGRCLLGSSAAANALILVVTSALFGLAHLSEQGAPGAVQAVFTGLVFGLLYLRYGRLGPVMWVHIGFDLVALWIIYNGLEEKVGRLLFH